MQNLFWASVVMRKRLGNVFKTNYTDFSMVSTSLQLSLTQKYEELKSFKQENQPNINKISVDIKEMMLEDSR